MSAFRFGLKLVDLHLSANPSQLDVKAMDHMKPYQGKKLALNVTFSCTHRCNLVCTHCQAENSDTVSDIPTKRFLEIIDEVADAGCIKIGFTGGEPLMRKDIDQALERCYERSMVTTLVSNGYPVFKHIEKLKKLSLLFISMDGNQEVNDKIRGEGSFDKILEAVRLAKQNNIPVALLTTLCSMNYHVVKEMCEIVEDLEVHWMIGVIQTQFTGLTDQDFSKGQLREMLRTISKVKHLRTSKTYMDFALGKKKMPRCFAGIGYAIIAPNGVLYPCFPAQFDKRYTGVSIMEKNFSQAYQELPLYRATCDTCALACHMEANFLYQFSFENIRQSLKLTKPTSSDVSRSRYLAAYQAKKERKISLKLAVGV